MASKAILFRDDKVLQMIMKEKKPEKHKKLGQQVSNFNQQKWEANCLEFVYQGNLAKFGQNAELKRQLLDTGTKTLAEASPYDRIWGIGLTAEDPRATSPSKWEGTNLLGKALERVREKLKEENKL